MSKTQPGKVEDEFNQRLAQDMPGSAPSFRSGSFIIAPFNIMWNHNRWMIFGGYYPSVDVISGSITTKDYTGTRTIHEITQGVGYAVVNMPRFRLYPTLASTLAIDMFEITRQASFSSLLSSVNQQSVVFERTTSVLELAVGADYSFPLEYGDVYIMAKVGYNFDISAGWSAGKQRLTDTDPNWFSRRGVFFQIGVGFGTERH